MGDQLYLERFVWFDHEARRERFPNPDEPEPNKFLSCYNYSQLQHGGVSCYSLKNTATEFLV